MNALNVHGGDEVLERISDNVGGLHVVDSNAPLGGRDEAGSIVRSPMFHPSSIDVRGDESREVDFIGMGVAGLAAPDSVRCVSKATRDKLNEVARGLAGNPVAFRGNACYDERIRRGPSTFERDGRLVLRIQTVAGTLAPVERELAADIEGLDATELYPNCARRH